MDDEKKNGYREIAGLWISYEESDRKPRGPTPWWVGLLGVVVAGSALTSLGCYLVNLAHR